MGLERLDFEGLGVFGLLGLEGFGGLGLESVDFSMGFEGFGLESLDFSMGLEGLEDLGGFMGPVLRKSMSLKPEFEEGRDEERPSDDANEAISDCSDSILSFSLLFRGSLVCFDDSMFLLFSFFFGITVL